MTPPSNARASADRAPVRRTATSTSAPIARQDERAGPVRNVLELQRLVGNDATTRLIERQLSTVVQRKAPSLQDQANTLAPELQTLIDGAVWPEIRKTAYPKASAKGIERAKKRKTGNLPDLTGLGKITTLEHFANAIKNLQPNWGALDQDGRMAALGQAINAELVSAGVPQFDDVVPRNFTNKGQFVQGVWQFHINVAMLNTTPLGDEDAAEMTNTTLHEARHAEQTFLAARYKAGKTPMTDDQLAADADIPKNIATLANQQKFNAQTGATTQDLGKQMYKALVTDRAKNQQTSNAVLTAINGLDPKRQATITARTNVLATPTKATIKAAKTARDALRKQIAEVEKRYTAYRNLAYERDAHEVGDAVGQAFRGWP